MSCSSINTGVWGPVRKYPDLLLFLRNLNIFQIFLFKVFFTYICTLLPFSYELLYSLSNHVVGLLLRYKFTAVIKATVVSYLFPASLFISSGNKWNLQGVCVCGGGGGGGGRGGEGGSMSGLYRGWDNLKELISSAVIEAVWEGSL